MAEAPLVELAAIARSDDLADDFAPIAYRLSGSFPNLLMAVPDRPTISDEVRSDIRQLLRRGGHKPAGRGRPASEALLKALDDGRWPHIHALVDECNLLSLGSGIPISALDLECMEPPFCIRLGQRDEEYEFNSSGQKLDLKGLLVLSDGQGPTGSPVKDAQRSKISESSRDCLILVWATKATLDQRDAIGASLECWCKRHRLSFLKVEVGK